MAVYKSLFFASLIILGSASLSSATPSMQAPMSPAAPAPTTPPPSGTQEYIKSLSGMYKNGTYISYRDLMLRQLRKGEFDLLDQYYNALQSAYNRGEINDILLFSAYAPFADLSDTSYSTVIDQWIAHSPKSYPAHFIKGRYLMTAAWDARGSAFADATDQSRLDLFAQLLKSAWVVNEASVDLTDKPILSLSSRLKMLRASNSLGYSAQDKFKLAKTTLHQARAMDNTMFWPRYNYMIILTPRWSGINDDYATMNEFVNVIRREEAPDYVTRYLDGMVLQDIGDAYNATKNYDDSNDNYCRAAEFQAEFIDYPFGQDSLKSCIRSTYDLNWAEKKRDPDSKEFLDMLDRLLVNGRYVEDAGWFYGERGQVRWTMNKDAAGSWSDFNAGAALGDAHSIYNLARTACYGQQELNIPVDPAKCVTMMAQAADAGAKITPADVKIVKRYARKR